MLSGAGAIERTQISAKRPPFGSGVRKRPIVLRWTQNGDHRWSVLRQLFGTAASEAAASQHLTGDQKIGLWA